MKEESGSRVDRSELDAASPEGAPPERPVLPDGAVDLINEKLVGFDRSLGVRFTRAELGEFVAELEIDERHHQPYGIVHGGVYSALVETVCSVASALNVWGRGSAVGLENSTSFLKAVRAGKLTCSARPELLGRRSHLWAAEIRDDRSRLVAVGKVRTIILEPGASADGEEVRLPGDTELTASVTSDEP